MHEYHRSQVGYTLLESMVSLTIMGILVALSSPAFGSLLAQYKEQAAIAELASELRMARMIAIAQHQRVDVRVADQRRKVVVVASNAPDAPMRRYQLPPTGVTIDAWPSKGAISFFASGRSASPTRIVLKGANGRQRTITVSLVGRVTVS
ncbi:MAG: GspH/FimT family pseudopilin [Nitrospiraceae bacterium]